MTVHLIPFQYQSHEIRVQVDGFGNPWWVAKDVCDALDYSNHNDVTQRLDSDEKGVASIDTPGGMQSVVTVNESGLYNLILGSRKPEAKAFKRWITHEVLPSIRTTGSYQHTPEPVLIPHPLLSHDRLELLKESFDFLAYLGMADDRDRLMYADIIRTTTRQEFLPQHTGEHGVLALPAPQGFFVAERVQAMGYQLTRKQETTHIAKVARLIASEYRSRYGTEPSKAQRYVDGAVRPVNWYQQEEASWADVVIQRFFADYPEIPREHAQEER